MLGPVAAAREDRLDEEVGDDVAHTFHSRRVAGGVAGTRHEDGGLGDHGACEVGRAVPVAGGVAVPVEAASEAGTREGPGVDSKVGFGEPGWKGGGDGQRVEEARAPGDGAEAFFAWAIAADGPHEGKEGLAGVRGELGIDDARPLEVVDVVDVVRTGGGAHEVERGARSAGGVGNAQRTDRRDTVGVAKGGVPGDGSTPVVADDDGVGLAKGIEEADDIPGEGIEIVVFDGGRAGGAAIAALVGSDDPVAGGGQGRDLMSP